MVPGDNRLFSDFLTPQPSIAAAARTWMTSLRRTSRPFSFYIMISGLLHLAVFWLLLSGDHSGFFSGDKGGEYSESLKSFRRAAAMADRESTGGSRLADLSDEDILALLSGMPALDPRFTKKERTDIIYKHLKDREPERSLEVAESPSEGFRLTDLSDEDILTLLSDMPVLDPGPTKRERAGVLSDPIGETDKTGIGETFGGRKFSSVIDLIRIVDSGPFARGGPALYRVDPVISRQLARLRYQEKFERAATQVRGSHIRVDTESGIKDIPADYFLRDCPYEEIAAVGADMFYFAAGFPNFLPPGLESRADRLVRPKADPGRDGFFRVILLDTTTWSPESKDAATVGTLESITLSAEERQVILDELMVLPEEEQFIRFAREYLERFNPDQEDLAHLTREFMYWNQSAVFVVASSFSAAFDFLEKLYFNKRIQGYLENYWRQNRGTRTGREILSVLTGLVNFEKRTLGYLFDAYETAADVLAGKEHRTEVLNPKAKALVIVKTLDAVMEAMIRTGIPSEEALHDVYDNHEIALLRLLADSGGETRDGALFSLGCLQWSNRRFDLAVEAWDAVNPSYGRGSFVSIMELIRKFESRTHPDERDYARIAPEIDEMIAGAFGSSSGDQLRRMIRFRKWSLRYSSASGS